ncbi:ADP-ribosylation factor-binding protein GGA1 [Ischnura elegans]|uniref:ADP-ribosylation factor-binding protein GGA1 n=1 Tax=Ischnura elegans TaxID=197161 RepID=UPI001ED87A2E|nr:ADP-ribosylation factor-binding protein GGA1 [Ischnura elegans]
MEAEVSSLEELIQHATSPQNAAVSTAAVGAFVEAVRQSVDRNGEAAGDISVEGSPASSIAHAAAKLIASKVQSPIEWEALQALNVLEACMGGCGPVFRAEVGKFRFLNELIKLVSPKYLGGRTPPDVQARVLALLRHWASVEGQNPPLPKVREAYAMLRKQGVVKDTEPFPPSTAVGATSNTQPAGQQAATLPGNTVGSILPGQPQRPKAAAFEDEHLSRLLQRLLQSKHPRDIQDANRLIKAMVRQEEMRAERRSRRATELESARTSARLLWEMLDSWSRDGGGVGRAEDEKELMAELHASCGRIAQIIPRLAADAPDEATMSEVLQTSDELNKAMEKYNAVMVRGEIAPPAPGGASLLDLSTPSEEQLPPALLEKDLADLGIGTESKSLTGIRDKELQAVLGDLFGGTSDSLSSAPTMGKPAPLLVPQTQSSSEISSKAALGLDSLESSSLNKTGGLNDLDALGESLLKQSLPPSIKPSGPVFNKAPEKIPMNLLGRTSSSESSKNPKNDNEPSFPLIGGSGIFMDSSSLSPNKESSKVSDIELLSDLMTQGPATNAKTNSEANSLDYLIGLSLSGAAKTTPIINPGKPLIPQTESVSTSSNPTSVSAFPSALNNKPIGSSISSVSKVPSSVVIPNAAPSASAVTFPSNLSPAHSNPPPTKKADNQSTAQDSVTSGMNLQSLEVLVESVLMGSGSTGGNRPSDSEGVSLLENALKSLMQPKDLKEVQSNTVTEKTKRASVDEEGLNGSGDDAMVSWSDGEAEVGEKKVVPTKVAPEVKVEETAKVTNTVKPIGDINIPLQRIRPGKTPPIVALAGEDGSGMSVELRLGHAESGLEGREDVSVLVITITSRLETPISNCLFQAVVPKGCRLRLLPASGTDLPAHNPFLPPAAITQVMLIASATKEPICLKWVLSYVTEDEETATEMGEVAKLPLS